MEWKQQTSENESQTVKDLQKIKDSIHQTINDLKDKKKELLLKMEEEKEKSG